MEQMTFFDKPAEFKELWEIVDKLKISHDKVRKRLFKEVKDLEKELNHIKSENEKLKVSKATLRWVG